MFTAEEALIGALNETTKVRGPNQPTDIVCLRLRSYMHAEDSILTSNDKEIDRRLDEVRAAKQTAKLARDSAKMQALVDGQDSLLLGDLNKALGVLDSAKEKVEGEHGVMNWCKDKGWLREENCQWTLLAMIERGLRISSCGQFLVCHHHVKQLHDFNSCVNHFTIVNNFHKG